MTGGTLRKRRGIKVSPPQYDDGVVRLGQCAVCGRDSRVLTKHEGSEVAGGWACADTDDCCQVVAAATTVPVSKARGSSTDAVRKVLDDGE